MLNWMKNELCFNFKKNQSNKKPNNSICLKYLILIPHAYKFTMRGFGVVGMKVPLVKP